ncbi:Thioesterase/thiol ester dehydrase-isomerase [Martensiomyces pterosporus]|nr:Thioesterase/thiol ester dehydrase-isomerase [Martensiomyces pterosporus]
MLSPRLLAKLPSRLATKHPQPHRHYAIPRSTAQRINSTAAQFGKMNSAQYVFSKPMLAVWAACCITFGVSISLFGVDQGWLGFVGKNKSPEAKSDVKSHGSEEEEMDAETYQAFTDTLFATDAAKQCLAAPEEWKRIPYFWSKNKQLTKSSFISGTLHGPEKVTVEPLVFLNRDRKQFVVIAHFGNKLCGHPGIVHGGVQATLFDEITARPAFWNLPRNVALTATLKVNYRRPVHSGQVLVFRTWLDKLDGRKAVVKAQLEDTKGNILSDAESLYISPSDEKLVADRSDVVKAIESVYPGAF